MFQSSALAIELSHHAQTNCYTVAEIRRVDTVANNPQAGDNMAFTQSAN